LLLQLKIANQEYPYSCGCISYVSPGNLVLIIGLAVGLTILFIIITIVIIIAVVRYRKRGNRRRQTTTPAGRERQRQGKARTSTELNNDDKQYSRQLPNGDYTAEDVDNNSNISYSRQMPDYRVNSLTRSRRQSAVYTPQPAYLELRNARDFENDDNMNVSQLPGDSIADGQLEF